MVDRKDLMIIAIATFCLTSTLFFMKPAISQTDTSDDTALILELQSGLDNLNSTVQGLQSQEIMIKNELQPQEAQLAELNAKVASLESEVRSLQITVNALEGRTPQK